MPFSCFVVVGPMVVSRVMVLDWWWSFSVVVGPVVACVFAIIEQARSIEISDTNHQKRYTNH